MRSSKLLLLLLFLPALARADVYSIGASYTWDGVPPTLEDSPQWHIYCGLPLIFIYENPNGDCVDGSPWPTTLPTNVFDKISFQPVPGPDSTLATDVFTISTWLDTQPTAKGVIHQTWPLPSRWEVDFHGPADHAVTNRSLRYGYVLRLFLRWSLPGQEIELTRSNEMLDRIYHDCVAGACPFPGGFDDLFRDASGHMSNGPGIYLTHNALRAAFGQTTGIDPQNPTNQVSPEVKTYLDGVIAQYIPEPGADLSLLAGSALIGLLARRRRSLTGSARCSILARQD